MICIRLFQMLLDQCLAPGPVYSHSGTVEGWYPGPTGTTVAFVGAEASLPSKMPVPSSMVGEIMVEL